MVQSWGQIAQYKRNWENPSCEETPRDDAVFPPEHETPARFHPSYALASRQLLASQASPIAGEGGVEKPLEKLQALGFTVTAS